MQHLLTLADRIDRLTEATAGVVRWSLLANALLIAGNAFSRKLFSVASASAYDLQWHFFAAVVLLMAAHTFRRDEHVRIDILADRFGERGLAWLDLIGIALVLLPLCIVMVWLTWPIFMHSVLSGATRATRESTSELPTWIINGFIPLGFFLLGLQGVAEAIRCIAALKGRAKRPAYRRQVVEGGDHGR